MNSVGVGNFLGVALFFSIAAWAIFSEKNKAKNELLDRLLREKLRKIERDFGNEKVRFDMHFVKIPTRYFIKFAYRDQKKIQYIFADSSDYIEKQTNFLYDLYIEKSIPNINSLILIDPDKAREELNALAKKEHVSRMTR